MGLARAAVMAAMVLAGPAAAQPAGPGGATFGLVHSGVERAVVVHLPPRRAIPAPLVVFLHGTGGTARAAIERHGCGADPTMPWWGGSGRDPLGRPTGRPAVMASAEAWGWALGCPTAGAASRDMPPVLVIWVGCPDGAAVRVVTRRTLGHDWPAELAPGRATADEIWRFFARATAR